MSSLGSIVSDLDDGLERIGHISAAREIHQLGGRPVSELRGALQALEPCASRINTLGGRIGSGLSGDPTRLEELEAAGKCISNTRSAQAEVTEGSTEWGATIGPRYRGQETNWREVEIAARWLQRLFTQTTSPLPPQMREVLLAPPAPTAVATLSDAIEDWDKTADEYVAQFKADIAAERRAQLQGDDLARVIEQVGRQLEGIDDLYGISDFNSAHEQLKRLGWAELVEIFAEQEVAPQELVAGFQRNFWARRLDHYFEGNVGLKDFRGRSHEDLISEFRRVDQALLDGAPDRIIASLNGNRAAPVAVPGSEVGILKREAGKKKRHMPVRRLLQTLPNLLPDLKPCLMMSPLTVSHYLSPEHHFDLVVFDEASQVPPWDAINCIYRADQLIIVGDSKQLPPTPFFQQVDPEAEGFDEEAERGEEVMESILDACEALLPAESLRWHYRSRHEHLISFSNHHFYNNKLVTFPAPMLSAKDLGVHLIHVPEGVYDRARSRTNRVEARRVAERVVEHLRARPERTVGVVAFSVAQAEAITDELDSLRSVNPDLDQHFAGDRLDGVFVKNLESVQGDERDVVIFSVGYGYDEHRKFHQGFGPLNKEGGHRRLNVAVTRARQQVDVVTSVRCSDFDLAETAKPGAQRLRDYLEFAEQGPEALRSEIESMGGEYESPFEESVAEAVRDLGYQIIPQVGVGGFRIDLGVVDPDSRGRFALGIECDGATYHSTPTARDRDRLRQEILEGLNWRIHRIWSWDWVRERRKETERLREAIQHAVSSHEISAPMASAPHVESAPTLRPRQVLEVSEIRDSADAQLLPWVEIYELADIGELGLGGEFHLGVNTSRLVLGLEELLAVEAPVSCAYAIKRLAAANGISRRGGRVVSAGEQAIAKAVTKGLAERRGEFLWRPGQELEAVRVPDEFDPQTRRDISDIAPEELEATIENLRRSSGAPDEEALITQAARLLGFNRTGTTINQVLRRHLTGTEPDPSAR